MTSHINLAGDMDNELDDAALWAVIDSAAAASLVASSAFKGWKPTSLKHASPVPLPKPSPHARFPSPKVQYNHSDGEVLQGPSDHRPQKLAKFGSPCVSDLKSEMSPTPTPLLMVKHVQRTPRTPVVYSSPESRKCSVTDVSSSTSPTGSDCNLITAPLRLEEVENGSTMMRHSLSGQFPTVSLFKEYQNAAMAILEKSDCTVISGNPYIKKSGWRKIAFYFNMSFEIKDKTIEFDENRDVQRAEFIVRAYMPGGRFADGWGSCERREKRFMKPNHDIPSTAETRAKNKACQDLLGIGEYRSGAKHNCR